MLNVQKGPHRIHLSIISMLLPWGGVASHKNSSGSRDQYMRACQRTVTAVKHQELPVLCCWTKKACQRSLRYSFAEPDPVFGKNNKERDKDRFWNFRPAVRLPSFPTCTSNRQTHLKYPGNPNSLRTKPTPQGMNVASPPPLPPLPQRERSCNMATQQQYHCASDPCLIVSFTCHVPKEIDYFSGSRNIIRAKRTFRSVPKIAPICL